MTVKKPKAGAVFTDTVVFPRAEANEVATVRVYLRDSWEDDWEEHSGIHCERISFGCAPNVSTAEFYFRYGYKIAWPGDAVEKVARLDINPRSYVRVVVTPTPRLGVDPGDQTGFEWVGVWRSASSYLDDQRQWCSADGLECLLNWVPIARSWFRDGFGALREAESALTFNAENLPNASKVTQNVNGQAVRVFETDKKQATKWSTREIVRYLLAANPPVDAAGDPIFVWNLLAVTLLPDWDSPIVETAGRTVWEVLTSLICRYRLTSFWVSPETLSGSGTTTVRVIPFTFTDLPIPLTDSQGAAIGTIQANQNQLELVTTWDSSSAPNLRMNASNVCDRVQVVGGLRQSVFTISPRDNTMEPAWQTIDQDTYVLHLATSMFSGSGTRTFEEAFTDTRCDEILSHVFAHWKLPEPWDQKAGNGVGTATKTSVFRNADNTAYRVSFIELAEELPLRYGYDYSGQAIANSTAAGHRGIKKSLWMDDKKPALMPVLVVLPLMNDPAAATPRWLAIDQIGHAAYLELEDTTDTLNTGKAPVNRRWSGAVRVASGTGLWITAHGQPQHVLAKLEMAGRDGEIKGAWDWRTMVATVAAWDDRRVEVFEPAELEDTLGEFVNTLYIDAGEAYKLIYVVPDTVVGIDAKGAGQLIRTNGGFLQDDRPKLEVIAKRAFQWYRVPRQALTLSTTWIDGAIQVGHLVYKLIDHEGDQLHVLTVITEINLEFPVLDAARPMTPRMTITTAFAEMDAVKVAGVV